MIILCLQNPFLLILRFYLKSDAYELGWEKGFGGRKSHKVEPVWRLGINALVCCRVGSLENQVQGPHGTCNVCCLSSFEKLVGHYHAHARFSAI
jgi:hypothetical protein